jgi:hypothetical protein
MEAALLCRVRECIAEMSDLSPQSGTKADIDPGSLSPIAIL